MRIDVRIQQTPDHALILRAVFRCFRLEEIDASLAECERYLDTFFAKCEMGRRWQEIGDNLDLSNGLIRVNGFVVHKQLFLCAKSRRQ